MDRTTGILDEASTVLRSPFRSISRWLAAPSLPGWLALRVWLVMGLMAPALGLGAWVHPATAEQAQVAELGLHAGPEPHGDPAEHAPDLSLQSKVEDSKDSEDELRERHSVAPLWLAPSFDLDLTAAIRGHRFDDAHDGGPGSSHRGGLHNRGPPRA
jgi:hypothetical protein